LLALFAGVDNPHFVEGTGSGYPDNLLAESEAEAKKILDSAKLQSRVLDHIQSNGDENTELEFMRFPGAHVKALEKYPYQKNLNGNTIEAILEVELLRIAFVYSLQIEARVRMISTATNAVMSDSHYVYISEHRKPDEWIANGRESFSHTLQQGINSIVEAAVDENFLLYYLEKPIEPVTAILDEETGLMEYEHEFPPLVPHYVSSPKYPEIKPCIFCSQTMDSIAFFEVDSLQPTLRWEEFPGIHNVKSDDYESRNITDVRYDLRIFESAAPDVAILEHAYKKTWFLNIYQAI
jgi:hypothetical protein